VDFEQHDFVFPNDDKLYVVELWSTSCGICLKKMPDFELLAQDFKHESRVACRLLNLPLERDTPDQAKQILLKRGVHLQSLFAKEVDSWNQLNIAGVPQFLLIRNGQLLESYNGRSLLLSNNTLLPDLRQRINELLKNR
jgi:thiol-disulfide isomerase/thioredoxin